MDNFMPIFLIFFLMKGNDGFKDDNTLMLLLLLMMMGNNNKDNCETKLFD